MQETTRRWVVSSMHIQAALAQAHALVRVGQQFLCGADVQRCAGSCCLQQIGMLSTIIAVTEPREHHQGSHSRTALCTDHDLMQMFVQGKTARQNTMSNIKSD